MVRDRPPAGLGGLLRWYAKVMEDETPDRLHIIGVEWDQGGGSLLGTPRWSPAFRSLVYACDGAVSATNEDGDYIWPCRAAIARMMRKRKPLHARWLVRLSQAGYDWRKLAVAQNQPDEYAEDITLRALELLWREYCVARLA